MPTNAQVTNRRQPPPVERHYTATVVDVDMPPPTVALDPGGAQTTAVALNDATYAPGDRVLVLSTVLGNYIIGTI